MKPLKSLTVDDLLDGLRIACNILISAAALLFCIVVLIDMFSRVADIGAYQQIAIDCVRSM